MRDSCAFESPLKCLELLHFDKGACYIKLLDGVSNVVLQFVERLVEGRELAIVVVVHLIC